MKKLTPKHLLLLIVAVPGIIYLVNTVRFRAFGRVVASDRYLPIEVFNSQSVEVDSLVRKLVSRRPAPYPTGCIIGPEIYIFPEVDDAMGNLKGRRLRASRMKTIYIIVTVCTVLAGCVSPVATTRRTDSAAAVAQRTEQLSAEFARVEREQRTPELRQAVHKARQAWIAYVQNQRQADATSASQGISLGSDYYRLRHRLLDAQFAQLRALRPSQ